MYTTPPDQTLRRHPIRGFFWGLLMGVGIAVLLILTNVIAIGTITPFLVVIFSALFGIIWGLFAPPRAAKGQPTIPVEPVAAAAVATEPAESVESAEPVEPMTPEQAAASRDTVVSPGQPADHSGTIVDSPTEADESAD